MWCQRSSCADAKRKMTHADTRTCTRAKQLPAAKYIINSHYEGIEAIYTAASVPGTSMAGVSFDIDTSEPADVKLRVIHLKMAFECSFHHVAALARRSCSAWAITPLNTTHNQTPPTNHHQPQPTVQFRTDTDDNCALPWRIKRCSGGRRRGASRHTGRADMKSWRFEGRLRGDGRNGGRGEGGGWWSRRRRCRRLGR